MRVTSFALLFGFGFIGACGPFSSVAFAEDAGFVDFTNEAVYTIASSYDPTTCRSTVEQSLMPGACVADPYRMLCEANRSRLRSYLDGMETRMLQMSEEADQIHARLIPEAEAAIGPMAQHTTDRRFVNRYLEYLQRRTGEELAKTQRVAVRRTLGEAKTAFLEAVRKSGTFPQSVMPDIQTIIDECIQNVSLDASPNGLVVRNATCSQHPNPLSFGDEIHRHEGESVRVLPESLHSCRLTFSGQTWLDCAEGRPACFQTVFHELGHALDSCRLYSVDRLATAASGTRPRVRPLDYESSYQRFLEVAGGLARNLAESANGASRCLRDITGGDEPYSGIPNACPNVDIPATDPRRGRCNWNTVPGYPSQWAEAEADRWSALALAEHFSRGEYAGNPARARADFGETLAAWCQTGIKPIKSWEIAKKSTRNQDRNRWLEASKPAAQPSSTPTPPGCESRPALGFMLPAKSWGDSHQSWEARFNSIILRTLELRRALGCETVTHPEVLMTCDGAGTTRTRIPLPVH